MNIVKKLIIISALFFLLISCEKRKSTDIARSELFALQYGKLENQIDLFQVSGRLANRNSGVFMRDGLFYVTDGNSGKIMEFTSYGDLIFLLYNSKNNPRPSLLNTDTDKGEKVTKRAVVYDFIKPGKTIVSSFNDIYVVDRVENDRMIQDKKRGVILSNIVLHFDKSGNIVNFLGQEGSGGTPFPYIESLFITKYDQPVVITRIPNRWEIFWFKANGDIMYHRILSISSFNGIEKNGQSIDIEKIIPDRVKNYLYVSISVYKDIVDPATKVKSTIKRVEGRIYVFDMKEAKFIKYITIPDDKPVKEGNQVIPLPSYELFGVTEDGFFYLLRYENINKSRLLILNKNGEIITEKTIVTDDSSLIYRYLSMDDKGIIYGLLANEKNARIVWWRTDKIISRYKAANNE